MTPEQQAVLENNCTLQLLPASGCAEVLGCTSRSNSPFLRREGPQVARLEEAEVQPCAIGALPLPGVIPSVHGLANPAGMAGASVSKQGRELFAWLPSGC